MRTFESPCFVTEDTPIWDVCFFSYPYIIETNVMTSKMPAQAVTNFNYYTKLHVFLKNRKDANFMEILGFDIDGLYRTDDTWLEPKVFEEAFASELIGLDTQKLWTHD